MEYNSIYTDYNISIYMVCSRQAFAQAVDMVKHLSRGIFGLFTAACRTLRCADLPPATLLLFTAVARAVAATT